MDFNKVILMGRLTRDVELRYTPQGTAVADLGMAVNHRFRRPSGEQVEEVCFIDVTVWGKTAENCNQYLARGRGVLVEGRLKLETWDGQDGNKRSKHKVIADTVRFLPRSAEGGGGGGGGDFEGRGREQVTDFGGNYNAPSSRGYDQGGSSAPSESAGGFASGGPTHDGDVPF